MKAPAFLGDGFKLILNGEKYPRPAMLSALHDRRVRLMRCGAHPYKWAIALNI